MSGGRKKKKEEWTGLVDAKKKEKERKERCSQLIPYGDALSLDYVLSDVMMFGKNAGS